MQSLRLLDRRNANASRMSLDRKQSQSHVTIQHSRMTTAWLDFGTSERGIIYMCEGRADSTEAENTNSLTPTVACPFHSTTTSPKPLVFPQQHLPQTQSISKMATSTLFPGNEALILGPLRQQIIGESSIYTLALP